MVAQDQESQLNKKSGSGSARQQSMSSLQVQQRRGAELGRGRGKLTDSKNKKKKKKEEEEEEGPQELAEHCGDTKEVPLDKGGRGGEEGEREEEEEEEEEAEEGDIITLERACHNLKVSCSPEKKKTPRASSSSNLTAKQRSCCDAVPHSQSVSNSCSSTSDTHSKSASNSRSSTSVLNDTHSKSVSNSHSIKGQPTKISGVTLSGASGHDPSLSMEEESSADEDASVPVPKKKRRLVRQVTCTYTIVYWC